MFCQALVQVNNNLERNPICIIYESRHVLVDCHGEEDLRVKLGVRKFVEEFTAMGNSRTQAYAGFLNGSDSNRQASSVEVHLARGWAILEIQTAFSHGHCRRLAVSFRLSSI